MIFYRFKVTNNQNQVIATGTMTASKELNQEEQLILFHNWNNGRYRKADYVTIEIFKV